MRTQMSFIAALSLAAGCLSHHDASTASIDLPLQQTGADGALYHLIGTFVIAEATGATVAVDGSSTQPSVTVPDVPPGLTNVTLQAGWTLEKSTDGGTTYTTVDAILSSPNPSLLRILANQPATTEFDFIVRNPSGDLTIVFGVDPNPRELEGGMIVSTGTLDYVPYINARLDFAIYFDTVPTRVTLPDGTKQLVFTSNSNNAMEASNDTTGLIASMVAPAMAGGSLQYTVSAKTDGTTEVAGSYSGFNSPFTNLSFGPDLQDPALPLDVDGYPVDQFFYDPVMPFTGDTQFADGDATLAGTLRMRFVPAH